MLVMRNITDEATATVTSFYGYEPIPLRGVEGCPCLEPIPTNELMTIHDRNNQIVWYARKNCPIHGILITDLPESPPTDTSTDSSTIAS
ncbi:hypothetical protein HOU00_gp397 [Caulobacter phage CcrPW]|uniref:Uncharacterized protein n=1 Tax=Caulobacter phage CcrPW TaxID=2283271 RepID=A0A385EDB6_9CAUD|nr:hypothetical protein HOU00_gp397 [Caulobacter phage CcrPW]AXQ68728.1 hypothetical protein CcrPW_gp189 [Caulobacter phage CcrPW]